MSEVFEGDLVRVPWDADQAYIDKVKAYFAERPGRGFAVLENEEWNVSGPRDDA